MYISGINLGEFLYLQSENTVLADFSFIHYYTVQKVAADQDKTLPILANWTKSKGSL